MKPHASRTSMPGPGARHSRMAQLSHLFLAVAAQGLVVAPLTHAEGLTTAAGGVVSDGLMKQSHVDAMSDPAIKQGYQWKLDQANSFKTQTDGIERETDLNAKGKKRLYFTPSALTAADCSPGRHWELIGGIAGCVCDGDATHKRVGNNEPAACVGVVASVPVPAPAAPAPTPAPAPVTITSYVCTTAEMGADVIGAKVAMYSDGSSKVVEYPSASCLSASTVDSLLGNTCSGFTQIAAYSSGKTVVVAYNSPSCGYAAHAPVVAAPTPAPTPTPAPAPASATVTGYFCSGYNMAASYSNGTSGMIDYNSPSCGYAAPAPAPVAAAPTPAPVADSFGGSFCSGTTLVGWMTPSGAQFVQEANSASCGYSAPVAAPAPVIIAPVETVGGYFCSGSALVGWMQPSGSQFVADGNSPSCAPPPYVVWSMYYCNFDTTNYAWSDGTYSSSGSGQDYCSGSDTSQ